MVKKEIKKKIKVKKKKSVKEMKGRDIGVDVPIPKSTCNDKKCPFHGKLPVRGQMLDGTVISAKMQNTVVVSRERLFYVKKYERYEKRTSKYSAHAPPCLGVKEGDKVTIMECRPLSKTVSFVVIRKY